MVDTFVVRGRPMGGMTVAMFALIPGAGGLAWLWHRVVPLLEAAGHTAVACDLPSGDDGSDLGTYTDACLAQMEARVGERDALHGDTVIVGQSLGGFTVPLLAERVGAAGAVLLNAMIPRPGETPGEWFATAGSGEARNALAEREGRETTDAVELEDFLHDLPADVRRALLDRGEIEQSAEILAHPARFTAWPDRVAAIVGRDDRFFPRGFQVAQARERLGVEAVVIPGGHLLALSQPEALVEALLATLT